MDFQVSYLKLLKDSSLEDRAKQAKKHLRACYLCPHKCGVDRRKDLGVCRARDEAVIASYGPHYGEERVLVRDKGSGTIFFSYCNLKCVFCQNYDLSFHGRGTPISDEKLAEIMLDLQNRYRCHNINLVSPSHFIANIIPAIHIAAANGLKIPIVYNSGGYENIDSLKLLDGIVDIYLPDFKYSIDERGIKYSNIVDYPKKVKAALKEMDRQVGGLKIDDKGRAYRGLIIRHLMLPEGLKDTRQVLKFISEELSKDCLVNLMNQYYPAYQAYKYGEINRRLNFRDYRKAYNYAEDLALRLD